jgi:nucleotide-binding universal stress UspA family protein
VDQRAWVDATVAAPASERTSLLSGGTVVVPLDGSSFSEHALPIARALADRLGGRLQLVTAHWDDFAWADRQRYLEEISARLADTPNEIALLNAHPISGALAELVASRPDHFLCMATHGRGRLRWSALGSVAEATLGQTRKPLVLVGRHCIQEWNGDARHMLVCFDGSSAADPIVPVAIEWARAFGLAVRVASVAHPLDVESATTPNRTVQVLVEQFTAAGIDASAVLLKGSFVAGAIADYARSSPAAIIAMNTHARAGVSRVALGSVAMATVGLAECPVLVAPPPA